MRVIFICFITFFMSACSSLQKESESLNYNQINDYMSKKEILGTPRDNLIMGQLNCFSDFDHKNDFHIENVAAFQFSHGEPFYYENYYTWDKDKTTKTKTNSKVLKEDGSQEQEYDVNFDGFMFQLELIEDENGEFYTEASFIKSTLVKNKKLNNNKNEDVFKYISHNQAYYPKNKLPYRFYEDKEEICYITLSW